MARGRPGPRRDPQRLELPRRDDRPRLHGSPGDDRIDGGVNEDEIHGGAQDDRITATDGEKDTIYCGTGKDKVTADKIDVVASDCESVKKS